MVFSFQSLCRNWFTNWNHNSHGCLFWLFWSFYANSRKLLSSKVWLETCCGLHTKMVGHDWSGCHLDHQPTTNRNMVLMSIQAMGPRLQFLWPAGPATLTTDPKWAWPVVAKMHTNSLNLRKVKNWLPQSYANCHSPCVISGRLVNPTRGEMDENGLTELC